MLAYLSAEGRFLDCDWGDWALFLGGLALVILATFLWV